MVYHKLIEGKSFKDERGKLNFLNDFSMDDIVRFYEIHPANTDIIRAWQGHQQEKKWFYCTAGSFIVNLIKIDDFEHPSTSLVAERFELSANRAAVLEISGGYATGFKANQVDSKLMVFSNFDLDQSKDDDYRYDTDYFDVKWD